jgi:hypothetical protein
MCVHHHDIFFFNFFYEKRIIVPTNGAKLLGQFPYDVNCMFFNVLHAPLLREKYALCIKYSICYLYLGYESIYMQKDGVKLELGFLFPLKL